MRGKSKITIAVLLCIAMISSTLFSSAAVFAASGGEEKGTSSAASSKIDDYLYDSQIITKDGKPYDPENSTINASGAFSVKLMFKEEGDKQFPDDGVMTYQIPTDMITGFEAVENQPIENTAKKGDVIGKYNISESGLITVDLDDTFVQRYQNVDAFLTFEGKFTSKAKEDGGSVEIKFSDSVSVVVKLEDQATLTINKESGTYNYQDNTLTYKIKVSTKYDAKDVVVTDTMSELMEMTGGALKEAITVKDSGNKDVSFKILDKGDATWKINVGNMEAGAEYTIAYTAKVTETALANMAKNGGASYNLNPKNKATAKASNSNQVEAEIQPSIRFQRIEKSYQNKNGKLIWTVTVNADKYLDLSGATLTDTMDDGLELDQTSSLDIKKDGTPVDSPEWNKIFNKDGNSWTYTFPKDAGKSTYVFTYKTKVPEILEVGQNGATKTFHNRVKLRLSNDQKQEYTGDEGYQATGARFWKHIYSIGYPKANGTNFVKDGQGNYYIRWTSVIPVPKTGLKDFYFEDYIRKNDSSAHTFVKPLAVSKQAPSANDNQYNIVNVEAMERASGKAVDISKLNITLKDGVISKNLNVKEGFTLFFGTDTFDQSKSALPANDKDYDVKVTCYTKVTGTDNGKRKNYARITSGTGTDSDWEDYDAKINLTGKKSGTLDPATKTILWTIEFNGNYASLGTEDVIIKDTFSANQEFDSSYKPVLKKNQDKVNREVTATEDPEDKSGCTYNFNVGKLDNQYNQTYTLTYRTKVHDDVFQSEGVKTFDNKASVWVDGDKKLEVKNSFDQDNNIVSKEISTKPDRKNQYKAGFTITVNPNRALLNSNSLSEARPYEIVDKYSDNLSLDLNSITITRDDKDQLDPKDYQVSQKPGTDKEDADKMILTIKIPQADGHKYTIKYNADVQGQVGKDITYSNTVDLYVINKIDSDGKKDKVTIQEQMSSAGAGGSLLNIKVVKADSSDVVNKKLENAAFNLYMDSVSDQNLLGTATTGEDGTAVFGQDPDSGKTNLKYKGADYYLKAGVKYILKETSAPDGYALDATETAFQLRDKNGNATLADLPAYNTGASIDRTNEKYNFHIEKISKHTKERLENAKFALFSDPKCTSTNRKAVAETSSKGIHTFKGLQAGTYYLKETKVPKGYYDSGKVYTVVIDNNGDATIDGEKVNSSDRTYTITNTLSGKITVTKETKEDGLNAEVHKMTYYTALFSDEKLEDRISEVKTLEMDGIQSTSVTFDDLEIEKTYYVAETDKDGKALPNQNDNGEWVVSYENQKVTLDPQNLAAESKITNSYFSGHYWSGSIDVAKNVKVNDKDRGTNYTFYAGIFEDEAFTKPAGEKHVVTLDMNGKAKATATFKDLAINKTYYVTETDKDGKAITDPQKQLGCEMTVKNNNISLTKEEQTGKFEITNSFEGKYGFKIQKLDAHTEKPLDDAAFTLFNDKDCKDVEAKAVKAEAGIYTFDKLMEGTYYLKETKVPDGYYDPEEVYTVVINADGKVTIDDKAVDEETNTYTITNTLAGKIRVTKEVKQNGVGVPSEEIFYAALFNDSEFTKEHLVSEVKALKMNNNESTTVTFDNVKVNETYYVVETDKEGNALTNTADDDTWAIAYDNQVVTLDPNNLTAESKITNSYFDQYYWAGSIDVTKRVTMDGKDFESNSIFYVGLYNDKDCTQQVGDIKPLVMDGKASTTLTFADLPINQTYYVAETDAEGKVITDSQKQLNCEMTIDKNEFTLTEENQMGSAVITNDFHDEEQFYYGGEITVNKTTTFKGKPYKTNEVFYVALFADKAHKERITDAKALKMNGGSAAKVTFENLSYGTYYLAETDKNGKALTELEAADLGFTNLMDEEIKLDGDLAEIGLENQMTEEFVTENGDDPENPKGTATQTGDDSDMALLILGMLAALTIMGILVINGRRRKIS